MNKNCRLSAEEALELYESGSLLDLGLRADEARQRRHPGDVRTYVVERNINYTNICQCRCSFCAFSVSPKSDKAYTLSFEQIGEKIEELVAIGGTQVLLQGGLNPQLPFDWYERMLRAIKERFDGLHVHGFSPVEIAFFAERFEMSVSEVLDRLRAAGLDTIPGGGAEILVDRVRRLISPRKCLSEQWLEVMRQAHRKGMCTTATMMFGHVETVAERIEHLEKVRRLQDESLKRREKDLATGYFTAFTCWPFQSSGTQLGKKGLGEQVEASPEQGNFVLPSGAYSQLKMTALARLYLDNIANIQASWVTQGPKIGQLSLMMGCNDIGSLMMEENVVAAAGTVFAVSLASLRGLIRQVGFEPAQRDCYYNLVSG